MSIYLIKCSFISQQHESEISIEMVGARSSQIKWASLDCGLNQRPISLNTSYFYLKTANQRSCMHMAEEARVGNQGCVTLWIGINFKSLNLEELLLKMNFIQHCQVEKK